MRLIGNFQNEKQLRRFQIFLDHQGIKTVEELTQDLGQAKKIYRLWVVDEEDFEKAVSFYQQWQNDSSHEQFLVATPKKRLQEPVLHPSRPEPVQSSFSFFSLTHYLIILCSFLFLWNIVQMARMEQDRGVIALEYELTPIQKNLFFDYPLYLAQVEQFLEERDIRTPEELKALSPDLQAHLKAIEEAPTWKGITGIIVAKDWSLYHKLPPGSLFGKIREGEWWRLITPALLHGGWLHIIFDMVWLYALGRQIEERIGRFRYLILSMILGIFGNVAEYLVSGPLFLGYSGIITGMVGFIWMRQKIAPWEGYPLQRSVMVFITVFVTAMFVLEVVSMALQYFQLTHAGAGIANTAHLAGGLLGLVLGRTSFFSRKRG